MQTKIKVLINQNNSLIHKNEINNNNSSIKTKANSSLYTISKDDLECNNKYKSEELYTLYKDNPNSDNLFSYKIKTMSNIKSSRNNNFFTLINRQSNKFKNNISMQNNMMKNFSSNSLRKNNSNCKKKSFINSNRKKKNLKQNIHCSNSLSITNNTYNRSKNNILINLNPKNMNVNMEKLKVQKKLYEYQKLIDQKLNELIKNRHPQVKRNNKYSFHVIRNSSPSIYLNNNSQRKHNSSLIGLEYFLRKTKKKSITPNTNSKNSPPGNNSIITKKIITKSNMETMKRKKNNQKSSNKIQSVKKKINSDNVNNLKQNLNKSNYNSKSKDLNSSKQENNNYNDSVITSRKENLSLRKYIFAKCNNPTTNDVKS